MDLSRYWFDGDDGRRRNDVDGSLATASGGCQGQGAPWFRNQSSAMPHGVDTSSRCGEFVAGNLVLDRLSPFAQQADGKRMGLLATYVILGLISRWCVSYCHVFQYFFLLCF